VRKSECNHTIFTHADSARFASPKKLAAISFPIHFTGVHLAHLRLRDFRNYARLDADFAQGKTNVFEAISNRYLPLPARLCYI